MFCILTVAIFAILDGQIGNTTNDKSTKPGQGKPTQMQAQGNPTQMQAQGNLTQMQAQGNPTQMQAQGNPTQNQPRLHMIRPGMMNFAI